MQSSKNQTGARSRDRGQSNRPSRHALDRLNFSLGDVRDVFEPFLSVFLAADRHWNPSQIGMVLATTSIAGILAQTPAGALVDSFRYKRLLIALPTLLVVAGYFVIIKFTTLWTVIAAQGAIGISTVIMAPAIAAISLGLVGSQRLEKRIGRNETFNHTGNVGAAIVAGLLGRFVGRIWIFGFLGLLCVGTVISVFQIRDRDIDQQQARAASKSNEKESLRDLFQDRSLRVFALAVLLFYLANAAVLPLVSQELTGGDQNSAALAIAACVGVAQLVMIPVAAWTGKTADRWGRKPLMLIAFAAVLLRAVLYIFNRDPWMLISLQALDGIASGIFSIMVVVVVADLTQGTGRFNLVQGAINTAIGIGAALSNLAIGFLAKAAGFQVGFSTLAVIAAIGLGWLWMMVPETKSKQ